MGDRGDENFFRSPTATRRNALQGHQNVGLSVGLVTKLKQNNIIISDIKDRFMMPLLAPFFWVRSMRQKLKPYQSVARARLCYKAALQCSSGLSLP